MTLQDFACDREASTLVEYVLVCAGGDCLHRRCSRLGSSAVNVFTAINANLSV
jgi:hypothetical protein